VHSGHKLPAVKSVLLMQVRQKGRERKVCSGVIRESWIINLSLQIFPRQKSFTVCALI